MTVIAYDGRTVAADRQATAESGYMRTVRKLWRADDGAVLAVCGQYGPGLALIAWYNAGCKAPEFPTMEGVKDTFLTVFKPGEQVLEYEGQVIPCVWHDPVYANGSGKGAALGALMAGASAREAVEIAIKVHSGCGGGVDVMELSGDTDRAGGAEPAAPRATAVS